MSLFLLAKLRPGNLRRRELSSETGCPAGLYAPQQESSMTSSSAVSTTTACQAVGSGYYSPAEDLDRYPCPQGSVAWKTNQAACTTCPAGTHAPLVASAVCTPCPRGSFTADTVVNVGDDPNALRIQCTVCNPLFYNGTGSDHALWLTPEDSTAVAVVIPQAGYYCLEPIATTEETPDDDNNNNNEFGDSSSTTNPSPTMTPQPWDLSSSPVPSASPTLAFTTTATTTPPPTLTTGSIESKSKNHPAVKEALVGNDKMGWLAVVILIVGSVVLILIVALVAWRGGWCGATKAGMDDTKPKGLSSSSDKNHTQEEEEEDSLEPGKEEATTTSTTMDSTASASSASARTSHKWWSHKGEQPSSSSRSTATTTPSKSLSTTKKDGPPHNAFGTQEEFPEPQWPTPEDLFSVTTNTPPTNHHKNNTGNADASSAAPAAPPISTIAVVHHHKDESRLKSYDYSNIL